MKQYYCPVFGKRLPISLCFTRGEDVYLYSTATGKRYTDFLIGHRDVNCLGYSDEGYKQALQRHY